MPAKRIYCLASKSIWELMQIIIDGISVEVTPKPIKTLRLRIYPPEGQVKMSVPLRCKEAQIRRFLLEKMPWIKAQRTRLQLMAPSEEVFLQTGSSISFLGKHYLLLLEEQEKPRAPILEGSFLRCYVSPLASQAEIQYRLESWYTKQMAALIPELLMHWQTIVGVRARSWTIRKMKTRWGSCNTATARVCLNLKLIQKPQSCLEYVLVHELVHLHEPSHNARFYRLMSEFMPGWREYDFLLEGKRRRTTLLEGASVD